MAFSTAGGGPFSTGPKMNVTPLIDVLLVLIIVFMVVVIEQRPTGLQTEIPHQNDLPPQRWSGITRANGCGIFSPSRRAHRLRRSR